MAEATIEVYKVGIAFIMDWRIETRLKLKCTNVLQQSTFQLVIVLVAYSQFNVIFIKYLYSKLI